MNKPKMIIFDYGDTLIHENSADFNDYKGTAAIMKYATVNKRNLSIEEIAEFTHKLFLDIMPPAWNAGAECNEHVFTRLLYKLLGLEFSINPVELEILYWQNAVSHATMPYIENVLDYLIKNNIRSGVISNISWSGEALSAIINKFLPVNNFEFIISSGDYGVRKPSHYIFDLALAEADLKPEDVWYCGDTFKFDVTGAKNTGIFPVWFQCSNYSEFTKESDIKLDFPCLHISDWREMIEFLNKINL